MPKYMLLVYLDGETSAQFYEDYAAACASATDYECGLGAYCELYERTYTPGEGREYKLLTAF